MTRDKMMLEKEKNPNPEYGFAQWLESRRGTIAPA